MLHNGGRVVGQDEGHYFVRIPNPGKGRYPSADEARAILAESEQLNPGPWANHSRTAAHCAEKIALYAGMCPEKAYVLGLLHDIGRRFGKRHLGHVSDGYSYMMSLDYPDAARICLTHSFNEMKIEGYVGEFDTTMSPTRLLTKSRQLSRRFSRRAICLNSHDWCNESVPLLRGSVAEEHTSQQKVTIITPSSARRLVGALG
ncbi:MAG: HD domain-containing protein [Lentisphaeria bacterium]|nr:HD domain-containing protein [Lentisphaeria bacterium]